jgi:hypothetical protein
MALTLNKIVKTITDLGNAHQQIKSVYFGDLVDYLSRGTENVYPSLYFDLTGGSITEKSTVLNFSLYFFDRVLHEDTNETEVLSDMLDVCQDIIAQLRSNAFEFDEGLSATLNFFSDDSPDLLGGVRADISIDIPFLANRCVVPSNFTYPS